MRDPPATLPTRTRGTRHAARGMVFNMVRGAHIEHKRYVARAHAASTAVQETHGACILL